MVVMAFTRSGCTTIRRRFMDEATQRTDGMRSSSIFQTIRTRTSTTTQRMVPGSSFGMTKTRLATAVSSPFRSRSTLSQPPSSSSSSFCSSSSWFRDRLVLYDKASPQQQQEEEKMKEEVDPGAVQGTDLRIVKYPHPALRRYNEEITESEIQDGSISKLAKEMLLLMYAAEGVGLAAPQVGVNKRLMVYNASGDAKKWLDEMILINPRIIEYSQAKTIETEACLSFPNMNGPVERSKWIKVEAYTANNKKGTMKKFKKKFMDWEARIFQHEYDHLDGTVYIDRLSIEDRTNVQPTLNSLIETHELQTNTETAAL